jgi:hypothetical protein
MPPLALPALEVIPPRIIVAFGVPFCAGFIEAPAFALVIPPLALPALAVAPPPRIIVFFLDAACIALGFIAMVLIPQLSTLNY